MSSTLSETLIGTQRPDTLEGGAGNDELIGRQGADVLIGSAGDDRLFGNQGQDTLAGGSGNDFLDGGAGRDTAVFTDVASNYSITRLQGGTISVKGIAGSALADGTDTLVNIERLRFIDRVIDTSAVPCFAAGTRICTTAGEIAVEDLREGYIVVLADGGTAPITWIGRRTVEIARHAWPDLVRPVRIRAGALADGVPRRDLLVSPEHALLVDGALVPAGLLANGRSIVQERGPERLTYFHIELPAHGVLLAEGAPAESYLEMGTRAVFEAQGAQVVNLHPHFTPRHTAEGCAPRLAEGPEAAAIRTRLAARAEAAFPMVACGGGDLRLHVDGAVLLPAPGTHRFALPAGALDVQIISTSACPALSGGGTDRRMLGVALSAIRMIGADGAVTSVAMDDPALERGFHAAERHGTGVYRWTDGEAVLPSQLLVGEPVAIELEVCAVQPVWVMRDAA